MILVIANKHFLTVFFWFQCSPAGSWDRLPIIHDWCINCMIKLKLVYFHLNGFPVQFAQAHRTCKGEQCCTWAMYLCPIHFVSQGMHFFHLLHFNSKITLCAIIFRKFRPIMHLFKKMVKKIYFCKYTLFVLKK